MENFLDYNPVRRCVNGESYSKLVPDTLDLAERLKLSINALTNVWIPEEKWALRFFVDFSTKQAVMYINSLRDAHAIIPPKFIEALILSRIATGSREGIEIDLSILKEQIGFYGENGLAYIPKDTLRKIEADRDFADIAAEARTLLTLSILSQIDDNPKWIEIGKRKIDTLLSYTNEENGRRYFTKYQFKRHQKPYEKTDGLSGFDFVFSSILLYGSAQFYRMTGYEPALVLTEGMANMTLDRFFNDSDGRWTCYHFHHSLLVLMGMCIYGITTNNYKILKIVDSCFNWAKEMGDSLIGYYPEYMPGSKGYLGRQGNTLEICELSDMVYIALHLSRAGIGDYWDDIDRWVRNMYAEGQITDAGFYDRIPEKYRQDEVLDLPYKDTENVPQKSVGAFLGWMRANEGLYIPATDERPQPYLSVPKHPNVSIMHCCTANGTRVFFFVLDSIVTNENDEICVNLLLNCSTKWVDVNSYLPVEGKIVLNIKDIHKVSVRIPEWCNIEDVNVTVKESARKLVFNGRYVVIDWLTKGDTVVLTFPIKESTMFRVIGEIPYKLVVRGSNVTSIDPGGVALPLFQNQSSSKLICRERFISDTSKILW